MNSFLFRTAACVVAASLMLTQMAQAAGRSRAAAQPSPPRTASADPGALLPPTAPVIPSAAPVLPSPQPVMVPTAPVIPSTEAVLMPPPLNDAGTDR